MGKKKKKTFLRDDTFCIGSMKQRSEALELLKVLEFAQFYFCFCTCLCLLWRILYFYIPALEWPELFASLENCFLNSEFSNFTVFENHSKNHFCVKIQKQLFSSDLRTFTVFENHRKSLIQHSIVASYAYILNGQKLIKSDKNAHFGEFLIT